jgi:glycosyltransferase involved in cell wall biosynthesis
MKKIKVLHVINELEPGGAEVLLDDMARYYDRDSFIFYVAYLFGKGTLRQSITNSGVEVFDLSWNGKKHPLVLFKLILLIHRLQVDIVHTHLVMASVIGRIAGKLTGAKAIVTTRHYDTHKDINNLRFKLDRWTTRFDDCLVVVSDIVNQIVERERLNPKRSEVIHNCTDIDYFNPSALAKSKERKLTIIGTIGRLSAEQKGYDTYLNTISELVRRHQNLTTEIIGVGDYIKHFKIFSSKLGITDHVNFLGRVDRSEVRERLAKWNIFLLCSNWEAFGIVVIEAMAMELPVVVSNVGGLSEIVRDGIDGFLVRPKDVHGFVEKIDYLINNPQKAAEMGRNGRIRIKENFSINRMIESYQNIYREFKV